MKKTGLIIFLFFVSQTVFASFLKDMPADSAHASLPAIQPVIPSPVTSDDKEYQHLPTHLSFTQKLGLKLLRHWLKKQNSRPRKSKWISNSGGSHWVASLGGFLLGFLLGPIGFGITRLTNNEPLRKGASVGFRVFLILIAVYLLLVLAVLLLLVSLGLI